MKARWLVLAISIIWVVLQGVVYAADVTFDLETASKTKYGTFLSNLRNIVKDSKLVYEGIPMLPAPIKPAKYLLAELKAKKAGTDITITLAVSKNDLYVVAFTDQVAGKLRAHYFPDINLATAKAIFPTATQYIQIGYTSNYVSIEGAAGSNRVNFQLGFVKLKEYMLNVYGKNVQDSDYRRSEARFLLAAIQMVAEAARFKYVESKAINNVVPDYKVPSLENNWSKISEGIRKAVKKVISPPIELVNASNGKWTVNQVSDIKPDMGILSYVP